MCLRRDRFDLHSRVTLAVTGSTTAVLVFAKLLDVKLLVLLGSDDGSRHRSAAYRRAAQFQPSTLAHSKHLVKGYFLAGCQVAEVDVQFHSFLDAILATTVDDDGIHGKNPEKQGWGEVETELEPRSVMATGGGAKGFLESNLAGVYAPFGGHCVLCGAVRLHILWFCVRCVCKSWEKVANERVVQGKT
jgi:hypothetical protein